MSSPKWSGKSKRFNPNRNFVMSEMNPTRKFNPKSTFSPTFNPSVPGGSVTPPTAPASFASSQEPAVLPNSGIPRSSGMPGSAVVPGSEGFHGPIPPTIPGTDALEYAAMYHPPLHPLQYQTYAPSPFRLHMKPLEPHERRTDDLTMPANLRKELNDRNEATLQILPASVLPEFVHVYHSLVPLDLGKGAKEMQLWGHTAHRYKAISHTDGRTYCLLCIDDFQMTNENEHNVQMINKWKRVQSAGMVGVVEAFTTLAFVNNVPARSATPGTPSMTPTPMGIPGTPGTPGTPGPTSPPRDTSSPAPNNPAVSKNGHGSTQSLVVVYEWYPLSQPLSTLPDPNEQVLWSIAVQLFSAIQAIHRRGLACRGVVNEQFILLQSQNRVRLGSLGARDVLQTEAGALQSDDYRDLGQMLQRLGKAVVTTASFTDFTTALVEGNIDQASQLLMPQLYRSMDQAYHQVDNLEDNLAMELENGRLVRLLAKLEFVLNRRDAFDPKNPNYSLVLFKQYAFRQRTEEGKPSLNLAHALMALNKLDAGIDENVLLVSEDSKTRIIVSYKELKHMFSSSFEQMVKS